jgi:hypothetical protein
MTRTVTLSSENMQKLIVEQLSLRERPKLTGMHDNLSGNCSGLWGDCSELSGDCSGLWGDCSEIIAVLKDRVTASGIEEIR